MISAFAAAGFTKLHLDCSMGCYGEPVALKDDETTSRAARPAAAAESARPGGDIPEPVYVYVIGTEVPIPGGAMHVSRGACADHPGACPQDRPDPRSGVSAGWTVRRPSRG